MISPAGTGILTMSYRRYPLLRSTRKRHLPVSYTHLIAQELGNIKAANMVALGSYLNAVNPVKYDSVNKVMSDYFKTKPAIVEINRKAILAGMNFNN